MEVAWQVPRTDLNSPMGLGQEEAKNLTHLLECLCSASELLEEEALVNADLSPTELEGNSLWTFGMVISRWVYKFRLIPTSFFFLAVTEMVRCSDAEFAAFRKRKTSKKVPQEVGATSGVEAAGDDEVPLTAPKVEPHIFKATRETIAAKGSAGAPQEAKAGGAGAAKGSQPTRVVPESEVAEATEAREEARCEAQGKRRVEEGPRAKGPTQKKRLASGPRGGHPSEVMKVSLGGSSSVR